MLMFYGHKYFAITAISAFQSFVGTQTRAHQDMLVMSGFTRFINFGWLLRIYIVAKKIL